MKASQFVECLSHMSVKGEGEDFPSYATRLIEEIDHGGLFYVICSILPIGDTNMN